MVVLHSTSTSGYFEFPVCGISINLSALGSMKLNYSAADYPYGQYHIYICSVLINLTSQTNLDVHKRKLPGICEKPQITRSISPLFVYAKMPCNICLCFDVNLPNGPL